MHFTNTIFSSNSNQEPIESSNVIFGNIILESTRQAADLDPTVKSLLEQAKAARDFKKWGDYNKILQTVGSTYPTQLSDFMEKLNSSANTTGSSAGTGDTKKDNNSAADSLIGFAMDSAKQVGKPARQRFELEKERVKQIALSRGWIPSADLAEWLRVFFDVHNLKEEIVYRLLNIAHNASVKSGVDTQTVLSLWSEMYGVFPDTDKIVTIINTTADLQAKYRSYGLFDVLRSMSMSPKANARYDGEFDNETDNLIWQELKSLVLRAPLEDNSYLSAQWMRSENKISRALEKAERLQQISDQIDSLGNNAAATNLINQITTMNRLLQTQGWYKAMQGVIYSLYAGKKAWEVFSAPLTNTSPSIDTETRDTQYKLQSQPQSFDAARQGGSSTNSRFVLSQTAKEFNDNQKKFEDAKKQITDAMGLIQKQVPKDALGFVIINSFLELIKTVFTNAKLIDLANGNIKRQLETGLQSLISANVTSTQNTTQKKPANFQNSFIKTSQIDGISGAGYATKAISAISSIAIGVVIINWFKTNIVSLAQRPDELLKLLPLALSFILELVRKEVIQDFMGSPLNRDSFFYTADGKPKTDAFKKFDAAVVALGGQIKDANAITTLEQAINRKIKIIDELETAVNSQIERDVQAGSENKTIRAPADSSGKLAQSIDSLNKIIGEALNDSVILISLYDSLLMNKDKQGIDPINISFIGTGRRRARITEEKLRSKRQRYASLSVIKEEIARYIRLNMLLGPIMARIKKFNNLGMSTASLISGSKSNPESLLKMMNEIRKNEQSKIDKVQKKISEIKSRVPNAESYTDSGYVGI
jgi:hypothetical protein